MLLAVLGKQTVSKASYLFLSYFRMAIIDRQITLTRVIPFFMAFNSSVGKTIYHDIVIKHLENLSLLIIFY